MLTILNCELGEGRSELLFDLAWNERPPGEQNRTGRCGLRFELPGRKLEGELRIDRDVLRWFLSEARRMHRELDGSARLCSWDTNSEVELKVVDRGRGIVAVGARAAEALPRARGLPDCTEYPFGQEVVITVGGLTIDQSYLPPFLDDVYEFLAQADADLDQAEPAAAATASGARPSYMILLTAADCPVPKGLRLLLEGVRKHGISMGARCLLFSTSRLPAAAMKGSPGMASYSRKRGITFLRSAVEWQGLPELFGLMARRASGGCTGMIARNGEFSVAETTEVAAILRRKHWLSEIFLALRGPAAERYAWRRSLAAVGQAAVLIDCSGTVIEVALHPADEQKLQRLVNAACNLGLRAEVRTETALSTGRGI